MSQHFSPDTCPLRIAVTVIELTDPETGATRAHAIDSRDGRAHANLAHLMMKAVWDPTRLDAIDGVPQTARRHPDDCPLCALHARPGPRVWGNWMTDAWNGHSRYQVNGKRAHRGIELFGDAAHARESVEGLQQLWNVHGPTSLTSCLEVTDLRAYIDATPSMDTRLVTAGSQLWLWDREPRRWWPDRVLWFGTDGIEESTGARIRRLHETGQVPSGVLGDPHRRPHRPDHIEIGELIVVAITHGTQVHVVSIRDRSSTSPARRVLSSGATEPLPETTPGLTVYGRYIGDRPPVDRIADLTPEYADLIPTITRGFSATDTA
ncbi:hypothetical protein OG225_41160 (plasmid) [Nocardia sp. NBC_01377]|uniref:hypothetical protein n=1 Tax=Nocardia sp. NBC_01377 TaxID=2903595 RepID=UPI002F9169C7